MTRPSYKLNLIVLAAFLSVNSPVDAMQVKNINTVKPPLPKVASAATVKDFNKPLTYANSDLSRLAEELSDELLEEQEKILEDLRILWQAAANRSETIRFAIYKLSSPDGDKQKKKGLVKKIFSPITNVASMVGMGSGDPVAAGTSVLGGGLLGSILADDTALNAKLTKVTDADLVILAKEIDDLQQKLVDLYYNYITSVKVANYTDKMVKNRSDYCRVAMKKYKDSESIADALYREALDSQFKARQELLSARTELEQFVGNAALVEVEKSLSGKIVD